jgi:hypothetical protein
LAELEGIELENSSQAADEQENTDDNVTKDPDAGKKKKKNKKDTRDKRKEALN